MPKHYFALLPRWSFWLVNLLFWMLILSYSSEISYQRWLVERPDQAIKRIQIWLYYLPFWLPWGLLAPLLVAATRALSIERRYWHKALLGHFLLLAATFLFFNVIAVPLLAYFEYGSLSADDLQKAIQRILGNSAWHMDFIVYLSVLCIGYGLQYYQRAQNESKKNEQLHRQLVQMELQALKSQLNPHFLFNTLNTIASLIRLDNKDVALTALSELGHMLREVLENRNNQWVRLTKEIEFINSYLSIQKLRFKKKLITEICVEPDCLQCEIPFMLLQPLVENAVHHGSQLETDQNMLKLSISCSKDNLHINLINKMQGSDEHHGFGIGMRNTRERLSLLYDYFELSTKALDGGYFEIDLILPRGE